MRTTMNPEKQDRSVGAGKPVGFPNEAFHRARKCRSLGVDHRVVDSKGFGLRARLRVASRSAAQEDSPRLGQLM
jgi:hypothetical protein